MDTELAAGNMRYRTAEVASTLYAALAAPPISDTDHADYAIETGHAVRDALRTLIDDHLNHIADALAPGDREMYAFPLAWSNMTVRKALQDLCIMRNYAPPTMRFQVYRSRLTQSFDCWDGERRHFTLMDISADASPLTP